MTAPVSAGPFMPWLHAMRESLRTGSELDVPCGDCIGCCSSSYFIHVRPEDVDALANIPRKLLFAAPGMPKGHKVMGFSDAGLCPMLTERKCTIYGARPRTCRTYDCRAFAATGILAGDEGKRVINERVQAWVFEFADDAERQAFTELQALGRFIERHHPTFPAPVSTGNPTFIAMLALMAFGFRVATIDENDPQALAQRVMQAREMFLEGSETPLTP